jgi:hypothetical protein
MNSFTKVGNDWCVRVFPIHNERPGDTVLVMTRAGASKQVTLGAVVRTDNFGRVFATVRGPARATENVGDLSRIVALFDTARQHLRFPSIVLDGFRVNVAGPRAREPGSLTVTGVERDTVSRFGRGLTRKYFGRVTRAGVFEPSQAAPDGIGAKLRTFAADPAGQAAEHGRLHGACCFCNRALRDERSTAVGYGPDCAENFGLPWGSLAAGSFAVTVPLDVPAPSASGFRVEGLAGFAAHTVDESAARARSIASEDALDRA